MLFRLALSTVIPCLLALSTVIPCLLALSTVIPCLLALFTNHNKPWAHWATNAPRS